MTELSNECRAGGTLSFGGHEWRVLDVKDGKALLLSERLVSHMSYHVEHKPFTWVECSLREWLNQGFYDSFGEDGARIATTEVLTEGGPSLDKVFLLSAGEALEYLVSECLGSADARVALDGGGQAKTWWLRGCGDTLSYIDRDGIVDKLRFAPHLSAGVRPALWLDLKAEARPLWETEHLLACLVEECAEAQQAACKALRFGLDDKYEGYPTPREQLSREVSGLLAVIGMLTEAGVLTDAGSEAAVSAKKEKVRKYMEYARERKKA